MSLINEKSGRALQLGGGIAALIGGIGSVYSKKHEDKFSKLFIVGLAVAFSGIGIQIITRKKEVQ